MKKKIEEDDLFLNGNRCMSKLLTHLTFVFQEQKNKNCMSAKLPESPDKNKKTWSEPNLIEWKESILTGADTKFLCCETN